MEYILISSMIDIYHIGYSNAIIDHSFVLVCKILIVFSVLCVFSSVWGLEYTA